MNIGLLLVNQEDDIIERVMEHNLPLVDCFYALDGTPDNDFSRDVLTGSEKCAGYLTDAEVGGNMVCGIRQVLHDQAVAEHGPDHWFLILHGDELWPCTVEEITTAHPEADGFWFRLPFYIPRVEDGWNDEMHPFDQLRWHSEPGWPEFRLFHGSPDVAYNRDQRMNTQPSGLRECVDSGLQIRHYPYRSPQSQRARATAGLDPDNYAHVRDHDQVFWTEQMVVDALCIHHDRFVEEVPVG